MIKPSNQTSPNGSSRGWTLDHQPKRFRNASSHLLLLVELHPPPSVAVAKVRCPLRLHILSSIPYIALISTRSETGFSGSMIGLTSPRRRSKFRPACSTRRYPSRMAGCLSYISGKASLAFFVTVPMTIRRHQTAKLSHLFFLDGTFLAVSMPNFAMEASCRTARSEIYTTLDI